MNAAPFFALLRSRFAELVRPIGSASGGLRGMVSFGPLEVRRSLDGAGDEVRCLAQLELYEGDRLLDISQRDEYLGALSASLGSRTAWVEPMTEFLRVWSRAVSRALHKALTEAASEPGGPVAFAVLDRALFPFPVVPALGLWADEGPAPKRPERFKKPNPIVTRLADWLEEAPELDTAVPVADALVALCFGAWRFVVAGRPEDGSPLDGEFWVVSPEGTAAMVGVRTIDGAQSHTILAYDGDTVTLRSVFELIARAVERAGLEAELPLAPDDEDEGAEPTSLVAYLRGRDVESPQIDWRIQGDAVGDGPLRDGYDPALRPGNEATSLVWDRFVRELFDPSYAPREGALYAPRDP